MQQPHQRIIKVDGICYNTEENSKTAEVTDGGYNYYKGEINIPSSIIYQGTTYKVTKIGKDSFRGCDITSVTIPNSVTVICNGAFSFCYNLTNIAIPNSVITIEEMAFIYCSGLASITIPAGITTIGTRAFDYCTALKTVYNNSSLNITKGATSNGNVAYYANVVINKNDDIIEDFVFRCALCAIRTTIQQSARYGRISRIVVLWEQSHFTSAVTAPSSFRHNSTLPFEGNCNMVTPSVAAFTTSKAFSAAKRLTRNTVSQFTGAPA